MVIKSLRYICSLCKKEYKTEKEAEQCESRGIDKYNYCYDMHTGLILCAHHNSCAQLNRFGHIKDDLGKDKCGDFHPRNKNSKPLYWKSEE